MKIGAPTLLLFLIAFALAGLAMLARLRPDLVAREVAGYDFWILAAAWVVLAIGVVKRGEDA
jgi:hypothetical protein